MSGDTGLLENVSAVPGDGKGIDSISVTPASYPAVVAAVAAAEHSTPANAGMERS